MRPTQLRPTNYRFVPPNRGRLAISHGCKDVHLNRVSQLQLPLAANAMVYAEGQTFPCRPHPKVSPQLSLWVLIHLHAPGPSTPESACAMVYSTSIFVVPSHTTIRPITYRIQSALPWPTQREQNWYLSVARAIRIRVWAHNSGE